MATLFHTTILATALVASAAVGLSGAAVFSGQQKAAAKADRLAVETGCDVASIAAASCPVHPVEYRIVKQQGDGVTTVTRIPVTQLVSSD